MKERWRAVMRSELDTACQFNMAEGTKLSSQNKKNEVVKLFYLSCYSLWHTGSQCTQMCNLI